MRVAIGGTFDPLHDGHKKLLKKVYELSEGGELVIGVTSDKMARANKDRLVLPYNSRAEKIRQYMYNEYGVNVRTMELNDRYGITLDADIDYIVISPETYNVALKIKRTQKRARQESDKDSKSGTCKSSRWKCNLFYADKSGRDR